MNSKRKIRHKIVLSIVLILLIAMAGTVSHFYLMVHDYESEILRNTAHNVSEGFHVFLDYTADILIAQEMVNIYQAVTPFDVKLTRGAVRNPSNVADDWEKRQIEILRNDHSVPFIFEMEPQGSEDFSRFIMPLLAREACLRCHGKPKGEIDERGYAKEGLELGELAGAISVTIPIEYANPYTRLQDSILLLGIALITILFIITIYLLYQD